jgi:hypothetical protein
MAMLTVLESLAPTERAVFVLREVFQVPYDEIAEAIDKSPAAVRQIAHRAREHVAARRPRMPVDVQEHQDAVARFVSAVQHGDLSGLLELLAPDVVIVADGGGLAPAVRRPIRGAERVASLLLRGAGAVDLEATAIWLNGAPALRLDAGGHVHTVVSFRLDHGRITHLYAVRNPEKLERLHDAVPLTRG